mgnify:CR=1 FL=1|tara:strand:- start:10952 stop:11170 length:219 start_codon:yes stop_codon:yes gene_type:complete
MIDGVFRSILSMLNIDPVEAGDMARKVVTDVQSIDARLARIEKALGIPTENEGAIHGDDFTNGLADDVSNGS